MKIAAITLILVIGTANATVGPLKIPRTEIGSLLSLSKRLGEIQSNTSDWHSKQGIEQSVGRLTWDNCDTDSDCDSPRFCYDIEGISLGCETSDVCVCIPPKHKACAHSSDCEKGESCFGHGIIPFSCLSDNRKEIFPTVEQFKENGSRIVPAPGSCSDSNTRIRAGSFKSTNVGERVMIRKRLESFEKRVNDRIKKFSLLTANHQNLEKECASKSDCDTDMDCLSLQDEQAGRQNPCCEISSLDCQCTRFNGRICSKFSDCPSDELCVRGGVS